MMKARANALLLGVGDWENDSGICQLCNVDIENLHYFIYYIYLQLPTNNNTDDLIKIILLFNDVSTMTINNPF